MSNRLGLGNTLGGDGRGADGTGGRHVRKVKPGSQSPSQALGVVIKQPKPVRVPALMSDDNSHD